MTEGFKMTKEVHFKLIIKSFGGLREETAYSEITAMSV